MAVKDGQSVCGHGCSFLEERTAHYVKIKQIRKLPAQPVYNMEVENTHCFAVNGGIIVHNCEDATRYLCKTLYTPRRLATL